MEHDYDAIVVGAGLAGAAMAHALAGMGWRTVLADRYDKPRHKVCGEFLSPESQAALASLGLEPLVQSLGPAVIRQARLTTADGMALQFPLPGPGRGISRYALDLALIRAASGHGAEQRAGTTIVGIQPRGNDYTVGWNSRGRAETVTARVVIGAWGRGAPASLTGAAKRRSGRSGLHGSVGVKCHFMQVMPADAVELYFFPGGYLGLSPVEGGVMNAAALVTPAFFREAGQTVVGAINRASRANPALGRRLASGLPIADTSAAVAPVDCGKPLALWGLVPHIGDAALVLPPLCGDGMSMALHSVESCANLANGYLRGEISLNEWRILYANALINQLVSPWRWGNVLQSSLGHPLLGPWLLRLGTRLPGLARWAFRATRIPI